MCVHTHLYIYHQVAVGMYRLGPSTTSTILKETPDIAVYAKMLSGGYLPLAATLATSEVFDAFLGNKKWHALLHGHSYTVRNMCLGVCMGVCTYWFCILRLCMYVRTCHRHHRHADAYNRCVVFASAIIRRILSPALLPWKVCVSSKG
jgi:hypothetical protein